MQNDQQKRTSSTASGFCGLRKRQKKELDECPVDNNFLSFCGIKRRRRTGTIWRIDPKNDAFTLPGYLEAMLADYTVAMAPTGADDAPAPIGMVLQLLLAETRRKIQAHSTAQTGAPAELNGPYWGYDQVIDLGWISGARGNVLDCELTYALWYGDPRYLETNCVIIQSEHPITDSTGVPRQYLSVLAAMSMIRHNRRPGEVIPDIYGIFTDGSVWVFFHLNKKFKYSSRVLKWNEGQQRSIVGLVCRIIRDAATIGLLSDETDSQSKEIRSTWNREKSDSSPNEDYTDDLTDSESATSPQSPDMEWLAELENRIMQIIERRKDDKDTLDLKEAFRVARIESQLPTKAATDIAPEDLWDIFGLREEKGRTRTWFLPASKRRGLPSHLLFEAADRNEHFIRCRLNAVMLAILAAKKREEYGQHGASKSNKRTSTESHPQYKSLRWALEKPFTFKWELEGRMIEIQGRMDFALWYGSREDIATNLVVLQARQTYDASPGVPLVIIYMAILYNARKKAGRIDSPIYGLSTDSWDWYFLRLDPNGVVSKHVVNWHQDPDQVISLIHKIMDEAACLTPVSSQALSRQPTVESSSDLDWLS